MTNSERGRQSETASGCVGTIPLVDTRDKHSPQSQREDGQMGTMWPSLVVAVRQHRTMPMHSETDS